MRLSFKRPFTARNPVKMRACSKLQRVQQNTKIEKNGHFSCTNGAAVFKILNLHCGKTKTETTKSLTVTETEVVCADADAEQLTTM